MKAPLPRPPLPEPARGAGTFRWLSWNVLADRLAHGSFIHSPVDSLAWPGRGERVVEILRATDADVLGLQEVDHFDDHYRAALEAMGYAVAFAPKASGRDGCGLAWREARFAVEEQDVERYVDAQQAEATQLFMRARLRERASGRSLWIATTHLKAKDGFEAVRARQAEQLAAALQLCAGPVVVGGDFNDVPSSQAYAAMEASGLRSAYAMHDGEEPGWTTWKARADGEKKRAIDFVFVRPTSLRVVACQPIPADADMAPERLPSWQYPSDHLSLAVDLAFSTPIGLGR